MDCTEFETLLSEALDGTLGDSALSGFRGHAASCGDCGPLLSAAEAGRSWLKALPEVEPPRNLVRNILIATSGAEAAAPAGQADSTPWRERLLGWARPLLPIFAAIRQPRFALSVGMAFFSVTVLLNAAGVHLSSLRAADLRPSAIEENLTRTYDETTARAVKYYENIRLVYEIESRVRELRDVKREEDQQEQRRQQPEKNDRNYRDDNRSGKPEPKQERYSRQNEPVVLAGMQVEDPAQSIPARRAA